MGSGTKRVIIQKQPYRHHKIGDHVLLPARVADQKIKEKLARVFGPEDWARQQKIEKDACEARAKDKAERKAAAKIAHDENEALRPFVEAKDALAVIDRRLAAAERRAESATGKKAKEWAKTVKAIKAEQADAQAKADELDPSMPAPRPKADGPEISVKG